MNPIPPDIGFALAASQALWLRASLFLWLLRHRSVKAPPCPGPRRCKVRGRPGGTPRHRRAKADWVRQEIIYLAGHLRGCHRIAHVVNRWRGRWETVGHTWVWQVMREHAEEIRQLRRERKRSKPAFIPVMPTWALDLSFVRSPEGLTFMVLGIIDAGSRKAAAFAVAKSQSGLLVVEFSRKCFFKSNGSGVAVMRTGQSAKRTSSMAAWGIRNNDATAGRRDEPGRASRFSRPR